MVSFDAERIIRSGLSIFKDEVGHLWCSLGEFYARSSQFEKVFACVSCFFSFHVSPCSFPPRVTRGLFLLPARNRLGTSSRRGWAPCSHCATLV